jgi:hypothetical protein
LVGTTGKICNLWARSFCGEKFDSFTKNLLKIDCIIKTPYIILFFSGIPNQIKTKMDIDNFQDLIEPEQPTSDLLESPVPTDLKILNYPLYKPKSINFISFNPEKKLVLAVRANSTLEILSYPHWQVLTRYHLDHNLTIRKAFWHKTETTTLIVVITINGYLFIFDIAKRDLVQK